MEWKDHVVAHPRTYTITENADGTVTLVPAFGEVVQQGTMLNAANMNSVEQEIQDNAQTHALFVASLVGCVMWYAKNTPPVGWLECNGSAVSRTTYANLFAVIGTTYGNGDGSTTFNLPDLRGEFVRGWDHQRDMDKGRVFGSAQESTIFGGAAASDGFSHITSGREITNAKIYSDYGSEKYSSSGRSQSRIRPHNVALLPIIKY